MEALRANHHPDCYPSRKAEALDFFQKALDVHTDDLLLAGRMGALRGIVVPHIDFRVSLAAYAAAFRPLLKVPLADTYIILGVGHRSRLEWNLDRRDYMTPLGRARCAIDLVDRLAAGLVPERIFSPSAHVGEHSIEFALLWLQALRNFHPAGGETAPLRFVPVLCGSLYSYVEGQAKWGSLSEFHRLSDELGAILRGDGGTGRVQVIVSIDGCHLGPRFQHPFRVTPDLLKATAVWEADLWTIAGQGDAREFLDWMRAEGNDRYFDGVGALALLLAAGQGALRPQRTYYEQWFTERDASAVTFSSGRVLNAGKS